MLILSQRRIHTPIWQAWMYELEDLLAHLDDAVLLSPPGVERTLKSLSGRRLSNGVMRQVGWRRRFPPSVYSDMAPSRVETSHDLFFVVIHHPYQLAYLRRLRGWRDRCRRAVCFLVEVWSPDVIAESDYLEVLAEFDAVYVFNSAVIDPLNRRFATTATFLPVGVDAVRSSPWPEPRERVINLYSFGRTASSVHHQLLRMADEPDFTYLYDTISGGSVPDHQAHRALLANMLKRSRYFLAHKINDSPERRERTGGDEALSTRYFEGSAGGAVMLGSCPRTEDFASCFDWDDAVIPLAYDNGAVSDVLRDLDRQPERIARARAANVRNSLLRHDWVYRWKRILADNGLGSTSRMDERIEVLRAYADASLPDAFV